MFLLNKKTYRDFLNRAEHIVKKFRAEPSIVHFGALVCEYAKSYNKYFDENVMSNCCLIAYYWFSEIENYYPFKETPKMGWSHPVFKKIEQLCLTPLLAYELSQVKNVKSIWKEEDKHIISQMITRLVDNPDLRATLYRFIFRNNIEGFKNYCLENKIFSRN